ncbi:hypothetical protein JH06_4047 [Blastocystis sp. subtype 4]|uniref:hypothetical protein n=1 Tax=Blastocystis sp. subtype 4 TaxID=944170 RepID=UPI000711CCF0|nr:hypothetical protein JH06_4047 [Blastocystis sp. subtype 4]KNB44673.1 hypothetical protein JH06_4047 [Blastocystis sp. subtype 4]|eukprot:XP_014528110.1 hypothetical protein JH06_4047 [Blastocystis sp. subtype 4]
MIASQMAARISLGSPAISACWNQESTQIYAGDASGKVILWDLGANASQGNPIAQHNHSIVSVQVNTAANCLTVGSLDGNVRLYDLRTPSNCMNLNCNGSLTAICNGVNMTKFAMTNGIDTYEYDLSNPSQPMSTYRETGDDFITSLAYSPTKFVIQGMVSGIVQVKYLNPTDNIKHDGKDLRFRIGRRDRVQYTCTALTVHNPSEGILTACADGSLTLWNAINRNKFGTFEKGTSSNPNGISACAYSYDGSMLVYAKGYNWDFGAPNTINPIYKMDMTTRLYIRAHSNITEEAQQSTSYKP